MKKSTLFLLAGAVVLAVITILVTSKGGEPPQKKLAFEGYATKEQLDADKARGLMDSPVDIPTPIDEVIIERDASNPKAAAGATKLTFARDGEGKESTWRMTTPVEAPAVKYQVERIIESFKTATASKFARALKEADLPRYDFEPSRRVRLTLKSKGAVWNGVDLVLGRVEKGEAGPQGDADSDTWVMRADDPSTAYLVAGKDLRAAVDVDMGLLRDKKVFGFEADDVTRVDIVAPDGQKIVLSGTRSETPPAPDAGPDAKPTVKVDWKLIEPAGLVGDASMSAYARSLAGLRVNDFVPLASAETAAKDALAGKTWTITAEVKPKGKDPAQTFVLKLADGEGETVWGQVQGKDELLQLAVYSAKNLRKGLDELKNKVVYDLVPEDVTKLTLKGDAGPISVVRGNSSAWSFAAPTLAWAADPTTLLKQLAKLTAVRWAKPSELEAARAALAGPEIDASLELKDGSAKLVRFSKLIESGAEGEKNRWGVVGDIATAEPFLVQDFNAKRFESTPDALRWKRLIPTDKDAIQRVEITSADGKETFALERTATEAGPGELTVVGAPAGKATKADAARTLGTTLAALDAKSFYDGKVAAESGLEPTLATKLVVRLSDGSSVTLLVSAKSAGEGETYALVDTGPLANTPVGINEYQAKNLVKTMVDLVDDAATAPAPGPAPAPNP